MGFSQISMGALLIHLLLSFFSNPAISQLQSDKSGSITAAISEKGLVFVKDFLVQQAIRSLAPLRLPDIKKSVKIPLIGGVLVSASNITLSDLDISSSTVRTGDTGIVIVASGGNASMALNWSYMYSTWVLFPIEVFDEGSASVQVEGMEVDLNISVENKNGKLALNVTQCSCYVEDIKIALNGGASWLYQGFVNAFEKHIRSAVENAIIKKIREGTGKLDTFLQTLPKQIDVDSIVALNVTLVDDPVVGNSSIEFDINGLFVRSPGALVGSYPHKQSHSNVYSVYCGDTFKMLGLSVKEAVFESVSVALFEEGLFHWIVDKVPDQPLLNTANWKFIIPQLYRKYPDDEMLLNFTLPSPPAIKITPKGFLATIFSDMTVEVLDGDETIPVACISVDFAISGAAEISGNKLVSKASLDDFSLSLKWSKIGNFRMLLIQGVMRAFLNTVAVPYVNLHLRKGFPIPVLHGLTLRNAQILTATSAMALCSDVAFISPSTVT